MYNSLAAILDEDQNRKIQFMKETISRHERIDRYQRELEDIKEFTKHRQYDENGRSWVELHDQRCHVTRFPLTQEATLGFLLVAKKELEDAIENEMKLLAREMFRIEIKE